MQVILTSSRVCLLGVATFCKACGGVCNRSWGNGLIAKDACKDCSFMLVVGNLVEVLLFVVLLSCVISQCMFSCRHKCSANPASLDECAVASVSTLWGLHFAPCFESNEL